MDGDRVNVAQTAGDADGVWRSIWSGLEDLVAETRDALGSHLRHPLLATELRPAQRERRGGELLLGRSRLRFECPRRCAPPTGREVLLADIFGERTPLVRIFVFRLAGGASMRLESLLAVDPATRRWIATEPALGPASLDDRAILEAFFWSVLADRG
ncbi:MAG: hypothetical protein HYY35_01705 [Deltaproteobacteria bacterium]|nr:hypothetical protein [Deltaproteobacteria bacterium]